MIQAFTLLLSSTVHGYHELGNLSSDLNHLKRYDWYVKFPCYQQEPRRVEVDVRRDEKFCENINAEKDLFCNGDGGPYCNVHDDCDSIVRKLINDASKNLEGALNLSLKIHGDKINQQVYTRCKIQPDNQKCPWFKDYAPSFRRSDCLYDVKKSGRISKYIPVILFSGCEVKKAGGVAAGYLTNGGHAVVKGSWSYLWTYKILCHELGHNLGADDFVVGSEGFMGTNIIKRFGTMDYMKTLQYSYEDTRDQICQTERRRQHRKPCARERGSCKCSGIVEFFYRDKSGARHPLAKRMGKEKEKLKCIQKNFGLSNRTFKDAKSKACDCITSYKTKKSVSCGGNRQEDCKSDCFWKDGKCQKKKKLRVARKPLDLSTSGPKNEIKYLEVRDDGDDDVIIVVDPETQTAEKVSRKYPSRRETLSNLDCSEHGIKYDFPPGNIVGTHQDITSWDLCQKECKNKDGCFYWTWSKTDEKCKLSTDHIIQSWLKKDDDYFAGPKSCYPRAEGLKIAGESCSLHEECESRFCKKCIKKSRFCKNECGFRKNYGEKCETVYECRKGFCNDQTKVCEPNTVENDNKRCDSECNGVAGPCAFCGNGSCCKLGENAKGCDKSLGRSIERSCVPSAAEDKNYEASRGGVTSWGGHMASSCERFGTVRSWCVPGDCEWKEFRNGDYKCQRKNQKCTHDSDCGFRKSCTKNKCVAKSVTDNASCGHKCWRAGPGCKICGEREACCQREKDNNVEGCGKGFGRTNARSCVPLTANCKSSALGADCNASVDCIESGDCIDCADGLDCIASDGGGVCDGDNKCVARDGDYEKSIKRGVSCGRKISASSCERCGWQKYKCGGDCEWKEYRNGDYKCQSKNPTTRQPTNQGSLTNSDEEEDDDDAKGETTNSPTTTKQAANSANQCQNWRCLSTLCFMDNMRGDSVYCKGVSCGNCSCAACEQAVAR